MTNCPTRVFFVPDSFDSFLSFDGIFNAYRGDEYFVFGNYLFGLLRFQGVARWNLKTGKCDLVKLPLFMTAYGGIQNWYKFRDYSCYPYWNQNYPDRLLLVYKAILSHTSSALYFSCHCYVLVDFAKNDVSMIAFAAWSSLDMTSTDETLQQHVIRLFEPDFTDKVNIFLFPPEYMLYINFRRWDHYFTGSQFWYHFLLSTMHRKMIGRAVFDFDSRSYETHALFPHEFGVSDILTLSYDRMLFFSVLYVDRLYPFLYLDNKRVLPEVPSWMRGRINIYGFSYESEYLYFLLQPGYGQPSADDIYAIHKDTIYSDPKNFLYNLKPMPLLLPIKESYLENSDTLYVLSSKYWINYSFQCSFVGYIPQLSKPVDLDL